VLGLGSNLGNRLANIDEAIRALAAIDGVTLIARAKVYETPPLGGPPQGDYLNSAVLVETSLDARALLERCLELERAMGRDRSTAERWGPRTIDIDILWIDGESVHAPNLDVPHPRLQNRPFALRPLLDVAPDATDPETGGAYALLEAGRAPIAIVDR